MKFIAVMKYKDGGEATMEYFDDFNSCLMWIRKQPQPKDDTWKWMIGEY